jgi:hypothetical protein
MVEISLRFTVVSEQVLKVLEEKQPSNVNKNTNRHKHTPRYPFIFNEISTNFPLTITDQALQV